MIYLITIPLAAAISLAWYLPGVKALGENRFLQKKDYWVIALKYGFAFTTLLIMVTEIAWDAIMRKLPLTGLPRDIFSNFFRAALLEEFFKFQGFCLAKKKYSLNRKIDYILTAGLIGMVYGIVEKIMLGNIAGVIVALLCPMHIIWQFNQGGHYFEYEKAKAANDLQTAKREQSLALLMPFFFHGCWDSALDISAYFLAKEGSTAFQAAGMGMILALVFFGVFYSIKTVRNVCKTAKEAPPAVPAPDAEA